MGNLNGRYYWYLQVHLVLCFSQSNRSDIKLCAVETFVLKLNTLEGFQRTSVEQSLIDIAGPQHAHRRSDLPIAVLLSINMRCCCRPAALVGVMSGSLHYLLYSPRNPYHTFLIPHWTKLPVIIVLLAPISTIRNLVIVVDRRAVGSA